MEKDWLMDRAIEYYCNFERLVQELLNQRLDIVITLPRRDINEFLGCIKEASRFCVFMKESKPSWADRYHSYLHEDKGRREERDKVIEGVLDLLRKKKILISH